MKHVLITGGAGFIGSHTADLLIRNGYQVRILDNLTSKNHNGQWPDYLDDRIERQRGDVRFKSNLIKAMKGIDYIIHLAAWMDMQPEFSKFFSVNTVGTSNIYELITTYNLPIKKVIVASSQFIYGQGRWMCNKDGVVFPPTRSEELLKKKHWDPICPVCKGTITPLAHQEINHDPSNQYAISKYTQEVIALKLGQNYQIPTVAFRYSIVHGPRQSLKNSYSGALRQFFLWLSNGDTVTVYEDGQQLRDFVSVFDVAKAHLLAIKSSAANYQVFNVGGGKAYTVTELSQMVGKALNKQVKVNSPGLYRIGDTRHSFSDISKLKSIGWEPTKTAQQNVDDFVTWAKTQNLANISVNQIQKKLQNTGVLRSSH